MAEARVERVRIYEPRPMGTKALQRLGLRLAERAGLGDDETSLYQEFIRDAKDRVSATVGLVEFLAKATTSIALPRLAAAEVVGRDKTLSTLIDKLQRTPAEKLPSIHDVAGVRVVANMSLIEQAVFSGVLQNYFDDRVDCSRSALQINRLDNPMHGYRAIHIVAWPSGRPVEIQIRTLLQHAWAQYMEVIGDRWGREARYGLPVAGDSEEQRRLREEVVSAMKSVSEAIAAHETQSSPSALVHLQVDESVFTSSGIDPQTLGQLRSSASETSLTFAKTEANLHHLLDEVQKAVDNVDAQTAP